MIILNNKNMLFFINYHNPRKTGNIKIRADWSLSILSSAGIRYDLILSANMYLKCNKLLFVYNIIITTNGIINENKPPVDAFCFF